MSFGLLPLWRELHFVDVHSLQEDIRVVIDMRCDVITVSQNCYIRYDDNDDGDDTVRKLTTESKTFDE